MARTATASATLDELSETLSHGPRLVDQRGRELALAPEVVEAFQHAIAELRSPDAELTTEAAAALLRISRPTLIRLLETGAMPYRRTQGTQGHRRIRRSDAVTYLRADLQQRRNALDALAADAEAFGFFEASESDNQRKNGRKKK
jgi:excisionase family DNA binding protein